MNENSSNLAVQDNNITSFKVECPLDDYEIDLNEITCHTHPIKEEVISKDEIQESQQTDSITENGLHKDCDVSEPIFTQNEQLPSSEAPITKKTAKRKVKTSSSEINSSCLHTPREIVIHKTCLVCLQKPYSQLTLREQLDIKKRGRPCPDLNIKQTFSSRGRSFNRVFSTDYYKKFSWLCGCAEKNRLFCFPCLLAGGDRTWTTYGFVDINHLGQNCKKHELSKTHIQNVVSLVFRGKSDKAACISDSHNTSHNKKVDENRHFFNVIIHSVKFCGSFEALSGSDEKSDTLNADVFRRLVDFNSELDSALKHLKRSPEFSRLSGTIQNDLLECMFQVCQEQIREEIKTADYFSVITDNSDASHIHQIAIIFRYLLHGEPKERFYQFIQLHPNARNTAMAKSILGVLELIEDSKNKLIAQSFDGRTLMRDEKKWVEARIKENYPKADFVHCHAHQLNLVVAKAASINSDVRMFFANISGISSFFTASPERTALLDRVAGKPKIWYFATRAVTTIFENKETILRCLVKISEESMNYETIQFTSGVSKILEDDVFSFWLEFFAPLMAQVDILYDILRKYDVDAAKVRAQLATFQEAIMCMRNTKDSDSTSPQPCKRSRIDETSLHRQAIEVCDVILVEIQHRFQFTAHLSAAFLLNSDKIKCHRKKFPEEAFREVTKAYGDLDSRQLKVELEVVYECDQFDHITDAKGYLETLRGTGVLGEVYKLCQILCTIPTTSVEGNRTFLALKKIKTFLQNTMGHSRLNALAMLSIESELVHRMADFNHRVIEKFAAMKNIQMHLSYR